MITSVVGNSGDVTAIRYMGSHMTTDDKATTVCAVRLTRIPHERREIVERNWGVLIDGELLLDSLGFGRRWASAPLAENGGRLAIRLGEVRIKP